MDLQCILIDDDIQSIKKLYTHTKKIESLSIDGAFNSIHESLAFLECHEVDLIILDVNVIDFKGFHFLEKISNNPMIIVISDAKEYAIQGFEAGVIDYFLKPITFSRFSKAIDKALEIKKLQRNICKIDISKNFFFIRISKKILKKIFVDDIEVVESVKDYIKINTANEHFLTHETLQNFLDKLPNNNFIRIHRSYIIAIDKIDFIEGNSIVINERRYNIGRSYIDHVKSVLLDSEYSE